MSNALGGQAESSDVERQRHQAFRTRYPVQSFPAPLDIRLAHRPAILNSAIPFRTGPISGDHRPARVVLFRRADWPACAGASRDWQSVSCALHGNEFLLFLYVEVVLFFNFD